MSQKMLTYIREEATLVRDLLQNRKQLTKPFIDAFSNAEIDRVFIVGSGSSRNVGEMIKPFVESILPIEVTVIVPSRYEDIAHAISSHSMLVMISQSGRSTNTIAAAKFSGIPSRLTVAITENPISAVAQSAGIHIALPWDTPETVGAKTKGVTCSTFILMLAFLELGLTTGRVSPEHYHVILDAMSAFASNHAENIQRIIDWQERIKKKMALATCMLILGQKAYLGAAMESALKLLETIYRPLFAYEFEEYLHGVGNTIGDGNHLLLMMPIGDDRKRMECLCAFAREKGSTCYCVYMDTPTEDPFSVSLLTSGNDYIDVLSYLLIGQVLSALLSEYCGYDIDRPRFDGFSTMMQTKA